MTFLSLLVAFVLEQIRPHPYPNWAVRGFVAYAHRVARFLNAGQPSLGVMSWCVAVLPIVAAAALVYWMLNGVTPVLGWAWNIVILYFTLGFRQVSHTFTSIVRALKAADRQRAKELLALWSKETVDSIHENDVAKLAIEESLRGSHRYVFGALAWFLVLPGPTGALLYRLTTILKEEWASGSPQTWGSLGEFADTAYRWIDWIPARLTALGFAVAGNFEDAAYCWRTQASNWLDLASAPLLASGAGALGIKLGGPLQRGGKIESRPDLGLGEEPEIDALDSTVGLIWRATIIWMVVLLLITIARWTG
jgi:adenosylcobinamide-phosphate synthase